MKLLEARQAHELQQFTHLAVELGLPAPAGRLELQSEQDVVRDRQPGIKRGFLEHKAAVAAGSGDRAALQEDQARRCRNKAAENVQQRAFAAPARSEQRHELAGAHVEIDILQGLRLDAAPGKPLLDVAGLDHRSLHATTNFARSLEVRRGFCLIYHITEISRSHSSSMSGTPSSRPDGSSVPRAGSRQAIVEPQVRHFAVSLQESAAAIFVLSDPNPFIARQTWRRAVHVSSVDGQNNSSGAYCLGVSAWR